MLLPADVAWAVAYGKRVEMQFVDAIDVMYDASIPWHLRFFRLLDHIVQTEPPATREQGRDRSDQVHRYREAQAFNPRSDHAGRAPASPEVIQGMSTFFANQDSTHRSNSPMMQWSTLAKKIEPIPLDAESSECSGAGEGFGITISAVFELTVK